jgi:hypothetical protein
VSTTLRTQSLVEVAVYLSLARINILSALMIAALGIVLVSGIHV